MANEAWKYINTPVLHAGALSDTATLLPAAENGLICVEWALPSSFTSRTLQMLLKY